RISAIRAMGYAGEAEDLPLLVELAAGENEAEAEAARKSLGLVPGEEISGKLVEMLATADPKAQAEWIAGLTARQDRPSLTQLVAYLDSEDDAIRSESWEAMGAMGARDELPIVIEHLKSTLDETMRKPIKEALTAIVRRNREEALPT